MSGIVTKATKFVDNIVAKSSQAAGKSIYWGKVGAELGKVIYKSEGLAPPNTQQFQQVYSQAFKFLKSNSDQKAFVQKAINFKPSKECAVKAGVYGIQLLAFFSIGEIIGRRSIFGYPSTGEAHH